MTNENTPDQITKRWGEAAWMGWQWAVCGYIQKDVASRIGYCNGSTVNNEIAAFIRVWSQCRTLVSVYGDDRKRLFEHAIARYTEAGGLLIEPEQRGVDIYSIFSKARVEHAFMLRCEGKNLKEIGEKLGVHKERARQMVLRFGRSMNRAMRRTHFRINRA